MNRSWKISTNQKSSLSGAIESGTNPRSASTESKSRTNRVDAARFPDKFILSVLPMPRFTMPSVERSNWETRRASVLVCGKNSSSFFLSSLFSFFPSLFFFFSDPAPCQTRSKKREEKAAVGRNGGFRAHMKCRSDGGKNIRHFYLFSREER